MLSTHWQLPLAPPRPPCSSSPLPPPRAHRHVLLLPPPTQRLCCETADSQGREGGGRRGNSAHWGKRRDRSRDLGKGSNRGREGAELGRGLWGWGRNGGRGRDGVELGGGTGTHWCQRKLAPVPLGLAVQSPGTCGLSVSVMDIKQLLEPQVLFHYKLSTAQVQVENVPCPVQYRGPYTGWNWELPLLCWEPAPVPREHRYRKVRTTSLVCQPQPGEASM